MDSEQLNDELDASAANTARSGKAIQRMATAERLEQVPHPDRLAQVLQRSEAARERQMGVDLLEPRPIVTAAGEAIPALGFSRDDRPT